MIQHESLQGGQKRHYYGKTGLWPDHHHSSSLIFEANIFFFKFPQKVIQ